MYWERVNSTWMHTCSATQIILFSLIFGTIRPLSTKVDVTLKCKVCAAISKRCIEISGCPNFKSQFQVLEGDDFNSITNGVTSSVWARMTSEDQVDELPESVLC